MDLQEKRKEKYHLAVQIMSLNTSLLEDPVIIP
jgi:hypothetical protein